MLVEIQGFITNINRRCIYSKDYCEVGIYLKEITKSSGLNVKTMFNDEDTRMKLAIPFGEKVPSISDKVLMTLQFLPDNSIFDDK